MNKTWINCVNVENIEFRILKSGKNASAYERSWKGAKIQFSRNSNHTIYVMTVCYNYGKRIDIIVSLFVFRLFS